MVCQGSQEEAARQAGRLARESAWDLIGERPGKVIAMHIGYAARAAQKGRTPEAPGYFLKPATSLTVGGDVELPAGCEILGFEGEIAVIIGRSVRRVSETDAWAAVSGVTAANDLGVFDLRWADKGANLRSKGGDGYTPVGPAVLPAADLDPTNLDIRVWLDGELVQQDNTSTLLFSIPQIISDLSQLMTLEPGDVILTGTPAGASTFTPGQIVEVEVSSGDPANGGATTGRLRTGAVRGECPLPSYSAQPKATPEQWADASGRPAEAAEGAQVLTDELRERIAGVAVATLSSLLRKRGLNNVHIDGLIPSQPDQPLIGTARTLRYVPNREDLFKSHGGGYNAQKRLFDDLKAGEVVVIEARGAVDSGTFGDLLALRARHLGAAGIITDGGVRDAAEVAEIGVPTYYAGAHPAVLGRRHVPWSTDETVACGGATVQPGDVLVGNSDGVLVIPPALIEDLVTEAEQQEDEEAFMATMVQEGHPIEGLFPMNATWRKRYDEERAARKAQP